MYFETWMIALFLFVTTWFMSKFYKDGYKKGAFDTLVSNTDVILQTLKEQKIIDVIKDDFGNERIVPGDFDAFIKKSEERES